MSLKSRGDILGGLQHVACR